MSRGALVLWLIALLPGCSRSPEPCSTPGTCPKGEECLANRCVVHGGDPVPAGSRRLVLEPSSIAVVSARVVQPDHALPPAAVFGSRAHGASALYLQFDPEWIGSREIDSAFLLLEPADGVMPNAEDVSVRAWRVRESWDALRLTWLTQPELAPPYADGIARSSPRSTLRVDVTEILRYLKHHPRDDRGLALVAGSGDTQGASFSTGAAGGRRPRLELYLR